MQAMQEMQEIEKARAIVRFIEMSHEERAQLLNRACKSRGVTLYKLAIDMRLKNPQQCYVYATKGNFGYQKMIQIAAALGVTVEQFVNS